MRYEEIPPISREEAQAVFTRDDPHAVVNALLGLALNDPDWRWVQDQCLQFSQHPSEDVRYAVPLCLMHLARLHGTLDVDLVFPVLENLQSDPSPSVAGSAEVYLSDIKWYLFRIEDALPYVRQEELDIELARLTELETVTMVLESLSLPFTRTIPATLSADRQLALLREVFESTRQRLALLGLGQTPTSADDSV